MTPEVFQILNSVLAAISFEVSLLFVEPVDLIIVDFNSSLLVFGFPSPTEQRSLGNGYAGLADRAMHVTTGHAHTVHGQNQSNCKWFKHLLFFLNNFVAGGSNARMLC